MRSRRSPSPLPAVSAPRRALAGLLAALVLALTLIQVSPEAHDFIHGHGVAAEAGHDHTACAHAHPHASAPTHPSAHRHASAHTHGHAPTAQSAAAADSQHDDDHSCAVVLFAQGVALPLAFPHLAAPALVARPLDAAAPHALFLSSPRYLRQPERGPPAA